MTEIHSKWLAPLSPTERRGRFVPDMPALLAPGELAFFGERLATMKPYQERAIRARAAGLSIPEIVAAFCITDDSVKNATGRALVHLGLAGHRYARVPRACYLLGRWDAEQGL